MTVQEIQNLKRDDLVVYEGKLWKFKSLGTLNRSVTVKIQKGNDIHFCARPEELSMPVNGVSYPR